MLLSGIKYALLSCAWLSLAALPALAEEDGTAGGLYRYRNQEGVLVIDFAIPPEYVKGGYEVVSPAGRLIKRVPPQSEQPALSEEQIQNRELQKKEDAFIVRSYSSLEDIERARTRRLATVSREISILTANLADYTRRREELRRQAANYQASGQQAPESLARVLDELEQQEANAKVQLAERKKQLEVVSARFDRYAKRFQALRPGSAPRQVEEGKTVPRQ